MLKVKENVTQALVLSQGHTALFFPPPAVNTPGMEPGTLGIQTPWIQGVQEPERLC